MRVSWHVAGLYFSGERVARTADGLGSSAAETLKRGSGLLLPWDLALALLDAYARGDEAPPAFNGLDDEMLETLQDLLLDADLPPVTGYQLELRARGTPGSPNFMLETRWLDLRGLPAELPSRLGGVVGEGEEARRLTLGQFQLLEQLSVPSPGRGREADLLRVQRAKAAVPAGDVGVRLDGFIERERVVSADAVKPRMVPVKQGYQLRPMVDGVSQTQLESYYFRAGRLLGRRPLEVRERDGSRTRVLFSERARRGLHDLRRRNILSPQQAAAALTNPREVLGPDLDVSDFSDRVSGVGPDIRRVVPIVQRNDVGDWWAWGEVELSGVGDGGEASLSLDLTDAETLVRLEEAVREAQALGLHYVAHPTRPGVLLELDERLLRALARAREQLEEENQVPDSPERQVLQVKDNLEEVEHDRTSAAAIARPETWTPPPNLSPRFDLQPHQREGYDWLRELNRDGGHEGALLADDMGLGKTLQVLAHLDHLNSVGRPGPHLVVAPIALLDNWRDEAVKFFGDGLLPIRVVDGVLTGPDEVVARTLAANRLVLVGYERFLRMETAFAHVRWDTVALDEAQKAKNPDTQIARALRTLNARFRLCMTGTPVENRLRELWTLYDWAVPGLLFSLNQFRQTFILPSSDPEQRPALSKQLLDRIGPVFIRRMKHSLETVELPHKHHHDLRVPVGPLQREAYGTIIAEVREKQTPRLGALQRLFAVCAHPAMDATRGDLPVDGAPTFPKGQQLFALLDEIHRRGEKALVFANRKRIQRWLSATCRARYGTEASIINGSVSGSHRRMGLVRRFSETRGFEVLVLAPRAAGVGLNIVAANHVIHYMREWNPAVEAQATDRAYRIGQTRDVHVYTITVVGEHETVEQRLDTLLHTKRQLMEDFVLPVSGFDVDGDEILAAAAFLK